MNKSSDESKDLRDFANVFVENLEQDVQQYLDLRLSIDHDEESVKHTLNDIIISHREFRNLIDELDSSDDESIIYINRLNLCLGKLIMGSFFLGSIIRLSSSSVKITQSINTANANTVRKELLKSDKIQSIVDARAQEIWNNHPAFKNKRTETARRIRHLVAADIEQQFGKQIPPGWGPAEEKMEIDRIRKRL